MSMKNISGQKKIKEINIFKVSIFIYLTPYKLHTVQVQQIIYMTHMWQKNTPAYGCRREIIKTYHFYKVKISKLRYVFSAIQDSDIY